MNFKYRISNVSYLNTIPFQYGLRKYSNLASNIIIEEDIPSECAEKIIQKKADIGLVPVGALKKLNNYYIVSDYCIGSVSTVKSVILASCVPLHKITEIVLDYQSRTSVQLVKVLCEKFWNISPKWSDSVAGFEKNIQGSKAAVIIGDRTFSPHLQTIEYKFDLSEEWFKFTGLPFVFAVWVSCNKSVAEDVGFIDTFNGALNYGVENIEAAIDFAEATKKIPISRIELTDYLTNNISYPLTNEKREAMEMFLNFL